MRFGIQMFGTMPLWKDDPAGFFDQMAKAGYRQIEPCIAVPCTEQLRAMNIWGVDELVRHYPAMKESGLKVISAHIFAKSPREALPSLLRMNESCGVTQFVFPCPRDYSEEGYLSFAEDLVFAAQQLKERGAGLLLHNGGGEISHKIRGKSAYEFLLDACGGLVGAQPDIGWLAIEGEDPEAFLWRNEERVWSLHYKDCAGSPLKEVPIGEGELDLFACFQFARAHGIPQVADMDTCTMENIEAAIRLLQGMTGRRERSSSTLCVLDTETGELTRLKTFPGVIEAPNWTADGKFLVYNSDGRIYRFDLEKNEEELVNTGECVACNNDHVLYPDGKKIAVSCAMPGTTGYSSYVFIVDPETGETRRVTENSPSFLHGCSPDGKEMAYCAFRGGPGALTVDIYSVEAPGPDNAFKPEKRLTDGIGYNDGPEYSPDGRHIWFNSTRDGLMQLYRMDRDGKNLKRMRESDDNDWFPHVSPNGEKVLFLSFKNGELDPNEHLPNMRVSISIMDADGKNSRRLINIFGGQGSVNVNSWAPDSRRAAVVIYELEHK